MLCLNRCRGNGPGEPEKGKGVREQYGPENIVVLLGAAEGEAAGLAAETVTAGDPDL